METNGKMSEQNPSYFERMKLIKLGLLPKEAVKKEKKPMKRVSDKKLAADAEEKKARGEEDTMLQKWYKNRQKQLTGKCMRCGEPYDHRNFKYAIAATAHILAKRSEMFPSVALHKDNFIELGTICGCHNWFDNFASWEEIALDKIWPLVLERFKLFESHITERTKIPEVLAQEIKPKI